LLYGSSGLSRCKSELRTHLFDIKRATRLAICKSGLDRLPHIDFIHYVVPRRVLREFLDKTVGFLFDVRRLHVSALAGFEDVFDFPTPVEPHSLIPDQNCPITLELAAGKQLARYVLNAMAIGQEGWHGIAVVSTKVIHERFYRDRTADLFTIDHNEKRDNTPHAIVHFSREKLDISHGYTLYIANINTLCT
jgi:hypothetical protein